MAKTPKTTKREPKKAAKASTPISIPDPPDIEEIFKEEEKEELFPTPSEGPISDNDRAIDAFVRVEEEEKVEEIILPPPPISVPEEKEEINEKMKGYPPLFFQLDINTTLKVLEVVEVIAEDYLLTIKVEPHSSILPLGMTGTAGIETKGRDIFQKVRKGSRKEVGTWFSQE